jgi:BMFP domain-containing protein YqiC
MSNKITVTRALTRLKTLDSLIQSKITGATFCGVAVNGKVNNTNGKSSEDFASGVVSTLKSIDDLITERANIKTAINKSNHETLVTIGGEQMTVAMAIERKHSVGYTAMRLDALRRQLADSARVAQRTNDEMEKNIDHMRNEFFSDGDMTKTTEFEALETSMRKSRTATVVSAPNIEALIEKLAEEKQNFEEEVDYVLSEVNATTFIRV